MHTPVCATRAIRERPDSARLSFETLLAHLTSESCGLGQNELLVLFCRTVRQFFGASGVCFCRDSGQGGWRILESEGHSTWGRQGESVAGSAAQSLAQAERASKAIRCQADAKQVPWAREDGAVPQVVVPIIRGGEFLGAALAVWPTAADVSEE